MQRKNTIKYSLFALLLLTYLPSFGQKVKEKKDVVYVDGVAMYKFYRSKGKFNSMDQEKVFTTMNDDTLVWVRSRRLTKPRASYEKGNVFEDYWELSFAGSDSTMLYKTSGSYIYEDIVKVGVLKDGKLDLSALPAFKLEVIQYLEPLRHLQMAIDHRTKLAGLPGYADYIKKLSERDAGDILHAGPGNIFYQNTVGAPPEQIGNFEKKQVERGIEYRIYRTKDRAYVASIIHEPRTGMVFIKTWIDKASFDYTIRVPFDNFMLENALRYLTEYGYL